MIPPIIGSFLCPQCGSSHFGRDTGAGPDGKIVVLDTVRCHGNGCTWRGVCLDSPRDYTRARKLRGTQKAVAAALHVARETICQRENGKTPISREAWLAMLALPARWRVPKNSPKH